MGRRGLLEVGIDMSVSPQDVDRVAELADLELNSSEKTAMVRDLNSLLDYFAQLNELDTSDIPPMSQVAVPSRREAENTLRSDEVVPSLDRQQVLACAPDTDQVFFRVPKVIER
jgi:aspartyl-tRNA(Asn)/glutamyl-tRNA(Gln) amidotransferase subunit C